MDILGISINHRTASVELREALHLNPDEIRKIIPELKKELFAEGFVLSTCNRTEIFGIPSKGKITYKTVIDFLKNYKPVEGISENNFEQFFSCSAVRHIFKVSAGVDSMVMGDSQILGQIKEAFTLSSENSFYGNFTNRLSDAAVKVGKRTISETRIGEGAVTISYAAVQVVEKIFANLEKKTALVIGAGETGELAAIHLRDKHVGKITITNRTLARAEKLAEKVGGYVLPFDKFKDHLHEFDIIISATSSEEIIISVEEMKGGMKKRKGSPVCLMDIAVPRDISPKVRDIDYVFYNDIDSLNNIVEENLKKRKAEIPKVDNIIMEEMLSLFNWYNNLSVVPDIKNLREFFENIGNDELGKIKNKVSQEDYVKLEAMTKRLIGRLLHNPTMKLRNIAESAISEEEKIQQTNIVKEIFGLNGKNGNKELN